MRWRTLAVAYSGDVPDTIAGLPLHPLVVHAAVVLVPLTAVGAVLMAIWPRFSRRFGVLVVVIAGVALVASVVAKESGEHLARQVGISEQHMELGDRMPLAAAALAVLTVVFWLFDRGIPGNRRRPWWLVVLAVILVVVALGAIYLTILTGHSGAEAVWVGRLPG